MTHAEQRERRIKAIAAVKNGQSINEAAAIYGLKPGTLRVYYYATGYKSPKQHKIQPRLSHLIRRQRKLDIIAAIQNGKSVEVVSKEFGLASGTIRVYCYENSIMMPRARRPAERRDKKIIEMLTAGDKSLAEIAAIANLSHERVRIIGLKHGVNTTYLKTKSQQALEQRKNIANEIMNGASLDEAVAKFKISFYKVRQACKENGVVLPRIKCMAADTLGVIADWFNLDMQIADIAKKHHASISYVGGICHRAREAGIPIPMRKNCPTHVSNGEFQ